MEVQSHQLSPPKKEVQVPSMPSFDQLPKELTSQSYAAFSLASLDQGSSRGSLNFDTGVFLKSGSFENLQGLLGSSIFKEVAAASQNQDIKPVVLPPVFNSIPNTPLSTTNPTPSSPNHNVVSALKSILPTPISSNVIATSVTSPTRQETALTTTSHNQIFPAFGNNALIQPKENEKRMVERKDENSKFVDVTPFLTLPQHEAAKKLGIPSSTLAKRWKEASCNRKWPYRTVSKLDKEILTLLKNVENAKAELSPSIEATLGLLLKKRQEELKTVLVRL